GPSVDLPEPDGRSDGGCHEPVPRRGRAEDEAVRRLALREGPPPLRRRRGPQTRPRGHRLHRPPAELRPQDHPPGAAGPRPTPGPGGRPGPKKGGGRQPLTMARPGLKENLGRLLQEFTGGDPMRVGVLWTNLSLRELSRRLLALGTP